MVAVLSAEEHPGFVEYIERMLLLDVHQWISQCSGGVPDLISADESLRGVEALIEQRSEHFGGPDAFYLDVSANANDGDFNDLKSQSLHSRAWEGFTPEECVETCALLALQRFSLYHQQGDL